MRSPEHVRKYFALGDRVIADLRNRRHLRDERGFPAVHLLVLPARRDPGSLDILRVPKSDPATFFAVRVRWSRMQDQEALLSPDEGVRPSLPYLPTVRVSRLQINAGLLAEVVRGLRRTSLPLGVSDGPSGLDGVSYELQVGDDLQHCRVGWWQDLPREWAAIEPAVEQLLSWFSSGAEVGVAW